MPTRPLTRADYESLARLRRALRETVRIIEVEARIAGVTPQQYHAMVAIRGNPGRDFITVGELAERLNVRHNSSVELINRLVADGLARKQSADHDRRRVCVFLTARGHDLLDRLCGRRSAEWLEAVRQLHRELEIEIGR